MIGDAIFCRRALLMTLGSFDRIWALLTAFRPSVNACRPFQANTHFASKYAREGHLNGFQKKSAKNRIFC